jgi:phosphoglycolate phosphatase
MNVTGPHIRPSSQGPKGLCDNPLHGVLARDVHILHHDVEHPFSLLETAAVKSLSQDIGEAAARQRVDPAFHAFNRVRKQELRLYPAVPETLKQLNSRGIRLVAFTDSKYFAALGRIMRLGLEQFFDRIYCRAAITSSLSPAELDGLYPELARRIVRLPAHESKPNPDVLRDIAAKEHAQVSSIAYVGDSLVKDVLMAKKAGCFAIWAKYGTRVDQESYERLIRISHWTTDEIAREREYAKAARKVAPDFICDSSIVELLSAVTGPNHGSVDLMRA